MSFERQVAARDGQVADFANVLNTACRSVFEVANMPILLTREAYLKQAETAPLLSELAEQSRMIHSFRHSLKS